MEYRILGRTGVKVSPLCLGTDNFLIREECDHIVPPGSAVANFHNAAPGMKMKILEQ